MITVSVILKILKSIIVLCIVHFLHKQATSMSNVSVSVAVFVDCA
jgi:hypothetical protein